MADLLIDIQVSGGQKAKETLSSIADAAKSVSSSITSFQDQIKDTLKTIQSFSQAIETTSKILNKPISNPFEKTISGGKDLEKAVVSLNKGLNDLNSGVINSKQFLLLYSKAFNDLKSDIKGSYGESLKYEGVVNQVNSALNKQKVTLNSVRDYFRNNTKELNSQYKALEAAEAAQQKYNRSVVSNELKRGAKALQDLRLEQSKVEKEALKAAAAQEKMIKSLVSNEFKKGAKLLADLRKEEAASAAKALDLEKAQRQLSKGVAELNSKLITADQFTLRYGKALNTLKATVRDSYGENLKYISSINSATQALTKSENIATKTASSHNFLSSTFKTVRAAALGYATVLATMEITDFIKSTASAGIQVDSLRRSLIYIAGDETKAAKEMKFLATTADILGLELTSLEKSYKELAASSKGTSLEGQGVKDIFVAVSKAASVLGMSAYDTEGALRAISQMMSKGNVQAEELRGQLGERLYGAFNLASQAIGVSTEKLNDMLKNGDVIATQLIPELTRVLENEFAVAAIKSADSAQAHFFRLQNTVTELKRAVGESGLIENLTDLAIQAKDFLTTNKELISTSLNRFFEAASDSAKIFLGSANAVLSVLRAIEGYTDIKLPAGGLAPSLQKLNSQIFDINTQIVLLKDEIEFKTQNKDIFENYSDEVLSLRGQITTLLKERYKLEQAYDLEKIKIDPQTEEFEKAVENMEQLYKEDIKSQHTWNRLKEELRKGDLDKIDKKLYKEKQSIIDHYDSLIAEAQKTFGKGSDIELELVKQKNNDIVKAEQEAVDERKKLKEKEIKAFEAAEKKRLAPVIEFNKRYNQATKSNFDLEIARIEEQYSKDLELAENGLVDKQKIIDLYVLAWFEAYDKDVKAFEDANEKKKKLIEDLQDKINKIQLSEKDYNLVQLEKEVEELRTTSLKKEQIDQYYNLRKMEIYSDANKKLLKESEKLAEENKKIYDDMLDDVTDFTKDVLDNWDDMGNTLVDMAESMVKDIAAKFLAQTLVMPVYMYAVDSLGLSSLTGLTTTPTTTSNYGTSAYDLTSLYKALTGGTEKAVSNFLSSDLMTSIGDYIFGAEVYGGTSAAIGAGTYTYATTSLEGLPVGIASPEALAAASGTASTGIVGTLSSAAPYGVIAGLAYTYLGDLLGLPQSEYSGLGATVGGTAGAAIGSSIAGGASSGAAAGSYYPVIGTIIGAIVGGVGAALFGEDAPDYRLGIFPYSGETDWSASNRVLPSEAYSYLIATQDYDVNNAASLLNFYDQVFAVLDEATNASINDILLNAETGDYGRMSWFDPSGSTTEENLTHMTEDLFKALQKGLVEDIGQGFDSEVFDFDFFESIQEEEQTILDSYLGFRETVEGLGEENFLDQLSFQMNTLGYSVEDAYANLKLVSDSITEISSTAAELGSSSIYTELNTIVISWQKLELALKTARATTDQLNKVEIARNKLLGSTLTGLTADTIQQSILSGGSISDIINNQLNTISSSIIAEEIYSQYIDQLNEEVGAVFAESGYDLNVVLDYIKNIDTSEAENALSNLQNTMMSLAVDTEEAERSIQIATHGQLTAAQQFEEWQINNANALSLYISILENGVSKLELQTTIDSFVSLGVTSDGLSAIINSLANEFILAQSAARIVTEAIEGQLTASQKFEEWQIDNISALSLYSEIIANNVTKEELEGAIDAFVALGIKGDDLNTIISDLAEAFTDATSTMLQNISDIQDAQSILLAKDSTISSSIEDMVKVFSYFTNTPSLSDIRGEQEVGEFDESRYQRAFAQYVVNFEFENILGRSPASSYWVDQLVAGTVDLDSIQEAIIGGISSSSDLEYYEANKDQVEITNWPDFDAFDSIEEHFSQYGSTLQEFLDSVSDPDFLNIKIVQGEFSTSEGQVTDVINTLQGLTSIITSSGDINTAALDDFINTIGAIDAAVLEDIFGSAASEQITKLSASFNEYTNLLEEAASLAEEQAAQALKAEQERAYSIVQASNIISKALNGQLTSAEQFQEWQIDNAEALSLYSDLIDSGITREELEGSVDAFVDLGLAGDNLITVIQALADLLISDDFSAAYRIVTKAIEGQLTAAQQFEEWQIDNAEALSLYSDLISSVVNRQNLEDSIQSFIDLGISGSDLTTIMQALADSFIQTQENISSIKESQASLLTSDNYIDNFSNNIDDILNFFTTIPDSILSSLSEEDLTSLNVFSNIPTLTDGFEIDTDALDQFISAIIDTDAALIESVFGVEAIDQINSLRKSVEGYNSSLKAITDTMRDLEIQILEAQGNQDEAVLMSREDVISDIKNDYGVASEGIIELQEELWALTDAAEAAAFAAEVLSEKRQLETQILEAQGRSEQALAMEREDILSELIETYGNESSSIIELQKELWDLIDAERNLTEAQGIYNNLLQEALSYAQEQLSILEGNLSDAKNTYLDALQREIDILENGSDSFKLFSKELESMISDLESSLDGISDYLSNMLISDESILRPDERLIEAQRIFESADIEDLPSAADDLLSAAMAAIADPEQYKLIFQAVQAKLEESFESGESQLDVLQKQLDDNQAQIDLYQKQIDELNGVNENLISIQEAEELYREAQADFDNNKWSKQIEYYEEQIEAINNVTEATYTLTEAFYLYQEALVNAISSGYTQINEKYSGLLTQTPQFANGGVATGPDSGYLVTLHGTELIIPLDNTMTYTDSSDSSMSNTEVIELLKTLITELQSNKENTQKTNRILDRVTAGRNSFQMREED